MASFSYAVGVSVTIIRADSVSPDREKRFFLCEGDGLPASKLLLQRCLVHLKQAEKG
ncbi:hypothetical protein [Paenibacillus sp. IITD108]|uniref:hypothetical protein n=1 Tax=Paenibacillus sp. IITD108 TaxID=3116649 RepID=UPI002F407442